MIEIRLEPADLARLRFARSPIQELASSLHVLSDPGRQHMHRPWLAAVRTHVGALEMRLLPHLVGGRHYVADFLTPPPERMDTEFPEELERVRASDAGAVRAALDEMRDGSPLAPRLRPLYDDPDRQLGHVVDELSAYWRVAIEPVWPRLRALLDADLGYRAQELTNGGIARLLPDLHPHITFAEDWLHIRTPNWNCKHVLAGTGVLLVPCVFAWPKLIILTNEPYQPMLTYAPRGIAQVWADHPHTEAGALGDLVGHSRAALLAHLDLPLSTSQLARHLGLTAATVSEHLSVLRRCRLVTSRRDGRAVLYQRTPLATRLLSAQD